MLRNVLDLRGDTKFRSRCSGMSSAMSLIILTRNSDSAGWNVNEYKCLVAFPMKITTCASIVPCVPERHQHVVMTSYFNIGKIFAHLYVPFNVLLTRTLNIMYVMHVHAIPLTSLGVIFKGC